VVSESLGWRKPHIKIFEEALRALQVKSTEGVFVGDSPLEDIDGARKAGLRTVFVASCFNNLQDVNKCCVNPDLVFQDLGGICDNLAEVVSKLSLS
jgi:putative hydrolase of the HAD superfamily